MTVHRAISLPHTAFTPARRVQFLDILASDGNVRAACLLTGISAQSAYKARRRDARFAAGWDAALLLARANAEAELTDRAMNGVEEVIFYRGEEVGRRRKHDNRLLLALLGRLDKRCGDTRIEVAAERFDEILAAIGGVEPEAGMAAAASVDSEEMGLPASRVEYRDWMVERALEEADDAGMDRADRHALESRTMDEANAAFDRWEETLHTRVDELHEEAADWSDMKQAEIRATGRLEAREDGDRQAGEGGPALLPLHSVNPVNLPEREQGFGRSDTGGTASPANGESLFNEAAWAAFFGRPARSRAGSQVGSGEGN